MLMKEGELNSSFLFTDQTVLMLMLELDLFSEDKHKYLVLIFLGYDVANIMLTGTLYSLCLLVNLKR